MFSRPSHLPSRMVWLVALAALGLWKLFIGAHGGGLASVIQGVGWLCFAGVGFMQPVLFNQSPSYSLANHEQLAIGPRRVRTVLTFAAIGVMLVGVVLRLTNSVV